MNIKKNHPNSFKNTSNFDPNGGDDGVINGGLDQRFYNPLSPKTHILSSTHELETFQFWWKSAVVLEQTHIDFNNDDEDDEQTPQPQTPKPYKEAPTLKPYKPRIPYPQCLRKEKMKAYARSNWTRNVNSRALLLLMPLQSGASHGFAECLAADVVISTNLCFSDTGLTCSYLPIRIHQSSRSLYFEVLIVGYEHVVMNCGSAGNMYLHSLLMFLAIKQLAIKWWDEYGFVIHP
nr:hypothetical protein [Tanacetum cinerariifolium]